MVGVFIRISHPSSQVIGKHANLNGVLVCIFIIRIQQQKHRYDVSLELQVVEKRLYDGGDLFIVNHASLKRTGKKELEIFDSVFVNWFYGRQPFWVYSRLKRSTNGRLYCSFFNIDIFDLVLEQS
ncbi:hypothetical protein D3C80_1670330 [compost metagenome]